MKQNHLKLFRILCLLILTASFTGCVTTEGNVGKMSSYAIPPEEASWVREGQPIVFEEELWYPQDRVDILLDSEVYLLGEYRDVQYFVERRDVRPYNYLYTKFGRNKFRVFEKRVAE